MTRVWLALLGLAGIMGLLWFSYPARPDRIKLIIDFDPGNFAEDLMMLQLALNSPELEVIGVTATNNGYAQEPYSSARITLKFLELAGRPDIPVAQGLSTSPNDALPDYLKLNANESWASGYPLDRLSPLPAPEFMDSLLAQHGQVTILATGPLSNVARLLETSKNLDRLERIVIMGGNFGSPLEPVEYNVGSDVPAAQLVLRSGLPITLVPSSTTWGLILWDRYYQRLEIGGKACHALYQLQEHMFLEWGEGSRFANLPVMFDSFALATLIRPGVGYYSRAGVTVDDQGMTALDPEGSPASVYFSADAETFLWLFTGRICS